MAQRSLKNLQHGASPDIVPIIKTKKVENLVRNFQKCYPQQDFFMVCLDMLNEAALPAFFNQLFQVDTVIFASGFTCYGLLTDQDSKEIDSLRITVNTVDLGAVATAMNQQWTETERKPIEEQTAIGRLARPGEITVVAAFLLSDQTDYITGATIPVNGGWY